MPALYPYLITGARIGLVHAIRAMVVAEMYVIVGYGGLIHKTGLSTSTAPLLGLLITLMAVSMLANTALSVAGRRMAPWYEKRRASA
jgi:ABC-type nitrate/sulfonate/bicarbonate transport system permease component